MQIILRILRPVPKNISPLPDTSHNHTETKQKLHKENGFTLIEIMVVIIIVGILASIAIGITFQFKEKALISRVESDLSNAFKGSLAFFIDHPGDELTLELLVENGYIASKDVTIEVVDGNSDTLRITATHPNVIGTHEVDNKGNIFKQ